MLIVKWKFSEEPGECRDRDHEHLYDGLTSSRCDYKPPSISGSCFRKLTTCSTFSSSSWATLGPLASGCPRSCTCLSGKVSRWHPDRIPVLPQPAPFSVKEQRFRSELCFHVWTLLSKMIPTTPIVFSIILLSHTDKIENGDVYQRRRGPHSGTSDGQETGPKQQESIAQTRSSWRRVLLLILAITIHNIPGENKSEYLTGEFNAVLLRLEGYCDCGLLSSIWLIKVTANHPCAQI